MYLLLVKVKTNYAVSFWHYERLLRTLPLHCFEHCRLFSAGRVRRDPRRRWKMKGARLGSFAAFSSSFPARSLHNHDFLPQLLSLASRP